MQKKLFWDRCLRDLTNDQIARLKRFAGWRLRALGNKANGRDAYDLFVDALIATAEERRTWKHEKVDLYRHLAEVIRSISDGWKEKRSVDLFFESELSNPSKPHRESLSPGTPEHLVEIKEIESLFTKDERALNIVRLLAQEYNANEIQNSLHISAAEYRKVVNRIRRKLQVSYPGVAMLYWSKPVTLGVRP